MIKEAIIWILKINLKWQSNSVLFFKVGTSSSIDIARCAYLGGRDVSRGRRNWFGYRFYSIGMFQFVKECLFCWLAVIVCGERLFLFFIFLLNGVIVYSSSTMTLLWADCLTLIQLLVRPECYPFEICYLNFSSIKELK